MTKKQIIARLAENGVEASDRMNHAELVTLAQSKGVSLDETDLTGAKEAPPVVEAPPAEEGYEVPRMITPTMAVCAMSGPGAEPVFPEAATETAE